MVILVFAIGQLAVDQVAQGVGGEEVRHRLGRRFEKGRLKNRNHVRASRTHPTSGLEVLCGLQFAILIVENLLLKHLYYQLI